MENPIKIDDLGVPLFLETPKWTFLSRNLNLKFYKNPPRHWHHFGCLEEFDKNIVDFPPPKKLIVKTNFAVKTAEGGSDNDS